MRFELTEHLRVLLFSRQVQSTELCQPTKLLTPKNIYAEAKRIQLLQRFVIVITVFKTDKLSQLRASNLFTSRAESESNRCSTICSRMPMPTLATRSFITCSIYCGEEGGRTLTTTFIVDMFSKHAQQATI